MLKLRNYNDCMTLTFRGDKYVFTKNKRCMYNLNATLVQICVYHNLTPAENAGWDEAIKLAAEESLKLFEGE